ncbi:MAG: hypothetical protein VX341_13615 [Bdellovibrionota bacterium]|nr:hypothetical protein [Bdellovibrionota bacterium]
MNRLLYILFFLFLTSSCHINSSKEVEIRDLDESNFEEKNIDKTVSVNEKIKMLRMEIRGIDSKVIKKSLNGNQKYKFDKRLKELKESLNQTIVLMKPKYTKDEQMVVETQYIKTKEIWDYLIRNYNI